MSKSIYYKSTKKSYSLLSNGLIVSSKIDVQNNTL